MPREPKRPLARWTARLAAYADARLRRALDLAPGASLDAVLLRVARASSSARPMSTSSSASPTCRSLSGSPASTAHPDGSPPPGATSPSTSNEPHRDIDELPRTPAAHFQLHVYAAVLRLRARLPRAGRANGLAFLGGYYEELAQAGFGEPEPGEDDRWWKLVRAWEPRRVRAPAAAGLRESGGLDPLALTLLFTVGLAEEDVRFAQLFEALNGITGEARPTLGLLATWTDDGDAREALHVLLGAGLLEAADPETARSRWALQVPPVLWDAMRGHPPGALAQWAVYRAPEQLRGCGSSCSRTRSRTRWRACRCC